MKRLDARTIRYQLHRLFVTTMLAVAALALLGKVAHAQASDPTPARLVQMISLG